MSSTQSIHVLYEVHACLLRSPCMSSPQPIHVNAHTKCLLNKKSPVTKRLHNKTSPVTKNIVKQKVYVFILFWLNQAKKNNVENG
jgi:hypothetical protein